MNLDEIKRAAAILLVGGVFAAVVMGLKVIGPSEERARKVDAERVRDLQELTTALDSYLMRHGRLAESVEIAAGEFNLGTVVRDPETRQPYRYRALSGTHYELCADFRQPSQPDRYSPGVGFWSHGAGRHCFEIVPRQVTR
jgi:hypothetical protein